ncbi:hypothetical protein WR25_09203 [Diploscapter pachys]|uniref:Pre-mRNA-splicing factor CWC25 homolog n=1 Tax=Diploscapter pachys TaxID=2018661 RepID=A0A2A2LYF4_9BILA|nr:hypothetical protein WR25_09203 [Diploscapter pachys]
MSKEDKDIKWMYDGAKSEVNREDYLLGKKVDKNFEKYSDAVRAQAPERIDAIIGERTVQRRSSEDAAKKSSLQMNVVKTEDPLVAFKLKQELRKAEILENPLMKMKMHKLLKDMMSKDKDKKKKKHKKEKTKRRKESSSEDSSSEESSEDEKRHKKEKSRDRSESRREKSPKVERKRRPSSREESPKREVRRKRHDSSGSEPSKHERRKTKEADRKGRESRKSGELGKSHLSPLEKQEGVIPQSGDDHPPHEDDHLLEGGLHLGAYICIFYFRRQRHESPPNRSPPRRQPRRRHDSSSDEERRKEADKADKEKGQRRRHDSRSPSSSPRMFKNDSLKREASPPAPETSTSVKKSREMTDEERRAVKLAEFQANANWRSDLRSKHQIKSEQDRQKEEKEAAEKKAPSFIRTQLNSAAEGLTVEQRLQSNKKNLQRSHGYMDRNFAAK